MKDLYKIVHENAKEQIPTKTQRIVGAADRAFKKTVAYALAGVTTLCLAAGIAYYQGIVEPTLSREEQRQETGQTILFTDSHSKLTKRIAAQKQDCGKMEEVLLNNAVLTESREYYEHLEKNYPNRHSLLKKGLIGAISQIYAVQSKFNLPHSTGVDLELVSVYALQETLKEEKKRAADAILETCKSNNSKIDMMTQMQGEIDHSNKIAKERYLDSVINE